MLGKYYLVSYHNLRDIVSNRQEIYLNEKQSSCVIHGLAIVICTADCLVESHNIRYGTVDFLCGLFLIHFSPFRPGPFWHRRYPSSSVIWSCSYRTMVHHILHSLSRSKNTN